MMKFLVTLFTLFVAVSATDVCHTSVVKACSPIAVEGRDLISCNSTVGGFMHTEELLQKYVNLQLATSYEYLLLATHFNSYQKNRPGFEKLYRKLSDKAWENAVGLIKKITQRGGTANFSMKHKVSSAISENLEVDEIYSLALALDSEKRLATEAFHIHRNASRGDKHDPEISHYFQEKFLETQAETVRKLSGYANDAAKLFNVSDPSLNIYLFDEYLQKQ